MTIVALDIGGANLKASDGDSRSVSVSFPLWKHPELLEGRLADLVVQFGRPEQIAVTMTGELADCFPTKGEGVSAILDAVEGAAPDSEILVWQTVGEFVSPEEARDAPVLVAAANWHALATWTARLVPKGFGLLVDVGSTTTDIIPIVDGFPSPAGRTDRQRLASGELVYTGVRRTPACALAASVILGGERMSVAAELFATAEDVHLVRGDLNEQPFLTDTADGRPFTRRHSEQRLARLLCCDLTEISDSEIMSLAEQLAGAQSQLISAGLERVLGVNRDRVRVAIVAGEGEWLARRVLGSDPRLAQAEFKSLGEILSPQHSAAAPAFALARLARESLYV